MSAKGKWTWVIQLIQLDVVPSPNKVKGHKYLSLYIIYLFILKHFKQV